MDGSASMRDLEKCFGEENPPAEWNQCFGPQAEWSPPALKPSDIFIVNPSQLKAKTSIRKTEVNIRIEDEGVQTCILPLFTKAELKDTLKQRKYDLIHFGCFRISVSPLFRLGMNSSAYVALFDNRVITFEAAKIGSFACPLHEGPVCVDIFPNYPISLSDIKNSWKLLIAVKGLERKPEAPYLAVKVSCMFRLFNTSDISTAISCYGEVELETKFGSTQSEGSIIQELRIPEFWGMTGHEPDRNVYKKFSLQEMSQSPGRWSVRTMFKPLVRALKPKGFFNTAVRTLKTKYFTLQLVQPGNSLRVREAGERSQTT